ncbi:hypothetical protein GCM10009623_22240 [Nocardioides aestuarii]|uniref:Alpha/beta fold hydrolase n=1 Tax=Nocardioides aestuarii TaxID=252231 RepID=A0ABW4TNY9_9ACTN
MTDTPVVLIRTALDAGELLPLGEQLAAAGLRPVDCPRPSLGSIRGEADSVAEQLRDLAHGPVHVVGASYSAAVALALASHRPDLVSRLTLVEPPPAGTAYDGVFRGLCEEMVADQRERGTAAALDGFMGALAGDDWRARQESLRAGSVGEIEAGAEAFFTADLAALLGWSFSDEEAAAVACPALVVQGAATRPMFAAMAERVARLVPQAALEIVPGADHLAASTHPVEVAGLISAATASR